jgi:glycosyltransferase involved in cell wall biosynthesis
MKIMHVISSTGLYGAERMIVELSDGLIRRGCEVMVVNLRSTGRPDRSLYERALAMHIPAVEIDCSGRFDGRALLALRRCASEREIDIIHSHGYKADFYAFLARLSRRPGIMATCHNWPGNGTAMRCYRALDKAVLHAFSRVAAVSEAVRRELERGGVPRRKIVMVPNGITVGTPAEGGAVRAALGIGQDEGVVTAVGRLSAEKGFGDLVAAAAAVRALVPGVRFLVIGTGPAAAALEAQIRASGLDGCVRLLGRREDVMEILAASDVFVMPSLTEGMPMALLEAMAQGTAVVATRVGEIPRMIEDGISGILVAPKDVRGIAEAIIALLRDHDRAERLGHAARRRATELFSAEAMTTRYMTIYEEILAARETGKRTAAG